MVAKTHGKTDDFEVIPLLSKMSPFKLALILLLSPAAHSMQSQNEMGLGHTSNANLSSGNPRSDSFYRLSSANVWPNSNGRFRLRLSFEDYFKEHYNDSLSWNASQLWKSLDGFHGWSLLGSVFGRHYTHQSPGLTDESFSHLGTAAKAEHKDPFGRGMALIWGPSVEIRKYLQTSERFDNSAFANAMIEFDPRARWEFNVFANAGASLSSQSEFSRLILEAGGGGAYQLDKYWDWNNELLIRRSHFLNRTISSETATTRSRGQGVRIRSVSSKETYTTVVLSTQLTRELNSTWRTGGELNWITQSSASGFQNYSAVEFYFHLTWIF